MDIYVKYDTVAEANAFIDAIYFAQAGEEDLRIEPIDVLVGEDWAQAYLINNDHPEEDGPLFIDNRA